MNINDGAAATCAERVAFGKWFATLVTQLAFQVPVQECTPRSNFVALVWIDERNFDAGNKS
jgi:hypothetical protein